jgi:hypothetical protein
MATIPNTSSTGRSARRGATRAAAAQQTRAALELRLLSLSDANAAAAMRTLVLSDLIEHDASPAIGEWARRAGMGLRTMTVQIPLGLAVFAVVAGAYALHSRGASTPAASSAPSVASAAPAAALPPAAPAPASFTASAAGSSRVAIPVAAGDHLVRVGVSPAVAGAADWFWCIESDRPLTADQHLCRSAGLLDPASGYVQSGGGMHVDDALAQSAAFFVQMYCPTGCQWRVDLVSLPAESATLP